jgi:bZIP transcription factor
MLSELLSTLETGDPNAPGDPSAPLFSDDTINALLGEQLRETAAQVALEMGNGQQHPYQQNAAPLNVQQQQTQQAGVELQTVLSGTSTSSMASLQEVPIAMQTYHQSQTQPIQAATIAMPLASTLAGPHQQQGQHQQQQQQQQYVTLLDGRILHKADGSAVLTSIPSGQHPVSVAVPGSTSVLQYIPVLNSQVVSIPQIQVQVQPTGAQQQQQQQQLAVAAMAAATLSGGALSDGGGSGALLPTTSSTPPATTPTSAAAATAAVYTSEISTTQQLVATAAAQQQWLQQEAANFASAASAGIDATNAANLAMREATSAMADVNSNNNNSGGQLSPMTMAMPPPPPRPPRQIQSQPSAGTLDTTMLQPPSLTPQLRPATIDPFPKSLASAVLAAQAAQESHHHQLDNPSSLGLNAGGNNETPFLRPAATIAPAPTATAAGRGIPEDGQLPRKPSHKRERSLRSASPALADPSTAPTIKCAKGHNNDNDSGEGTSSSGGSSGLGTSPDSCILAAAVAASVGGSSGDASPLNGVYTRSNIMPEPPLAHQPQNFQQQEQQPPALAPASTTTTADVNNSADANAAAAGSFEVEDDVMALMQAALAPKAGKRRGRPPGSRTNTTPAAPDEPREPSDAEILEIVLREDPSRRNLPVDEIKKLVRKEKNRIAAAISRIRTANYTAALESRVKALQAEQAELSGWLQAPPQALPHRVLLVGPAAAAAAAAAGAAGGVLDANGQPLRPPIRHLSL